MALSDAEVAIAAARTGAEVVVRDFGAEHVRLAKSATDFATTTDLDAETAILAAHRPEDACLGEEFGEGGPDGADRRWYVDPLCGTLNFAASTPLFAVNVALVERGLGRAAAVVDPIADETFWTDGSRALLRRGEVDKELAPSPLTALVEINCDGPLDQPFVGPQLVQDRDLLTSFAPRVISTSLGVVWVAAGRRAAYVSDGEITGSVHFVAGVTIACAAGCVVSDLAGDPLGTGPGLLVSADAETHESLLALVAPHLAAVTGAT